MTENVRLTIEIAEFVFWESVEIVRSIDTFSSVQFTAPMEPERSEFRETFRPFSFKPMTIYVGDEQLFTGTMMGISPSVTEGEQTVSVSAYASPGVLEDCTMPLDAYPLEFNNVRIGDIACEVARHFQLGVSVMADEGAKFKRVKMESGDKPAEFLAKLCRQRNMVMADQPDGFLMLLRSAETGPIVATFAEDERPVTEVSASFSPQDYFSEITGNSPTRGGRKGSSYTVQNPHANPVGQTVTTIRPGAFDIDDTEDADTPDATRAQMGRMFGNVVGYTIKVPTWRDEDGELFAPNTFVSLHAPGAMVYAPTTLLVRGVTLRQDSESETAELTCVLPGAFSGEIPEALPWQE